MNDFNPDFASPAEWAAEYRAHGLQVVPCYAPGEPRDGGAWKRPHLKTWMPYRDTLISDEEWAKWYAPGGEHADRMNMGIIAGPCSGNLIVLDLDTQKTPEAAMWWRALCEVHNNRIEPETVQQRTGGGGRQLLFYAPSGWAVPTCKTTRGVDVRGYGGFAVMPPSLHESGRHYDWVVGHAPWETEISRAPEWLLDAIVDLVDDHGAASAPPPGGNGHAGTYEYDAWGDVKNGREDVLFRHVWRQVLEWARENLRNNGDLTIPPEPEWRVRAWTAYQFYEAKVTLQKPSSKSKREQLEEDDRGWTEYWKKFRRAIRTHWGTSEFEAEVAKPPPDPEPAGPRASDPPQWDEFTTKVDSIPLRSAFPINEAKIPVRDWGVPGLFLKRHLTVFVAPPGTGKSLLTLQISIMCGSGVGWGGWQPRRAEKVLIINSEDDGDEIDRRLAASARDMGIEQDVLVGQVLRVDAPESIVIARVDGRTKTVVRMPLIEVLVQTIKDAGIGLVIVDPFAETFEGDENSNSEVKWAGILWREVARRTGASLMLVHHTKKYAGDMAGVADASRGGGALIGTARIISTLFSMTEDEAVAMDVAVEDRNRFVRFDDAKANYSRLTNARWFEKKSITLNNATAFIPGDEVGVLAPWAPPGSLDGVSMEKLNEALDVIDRGIVDEDDHPTGQYYTAAATSAHKDRWAGSVLIWATDMPEASARALIKKWLDDGVLIPFEYKDPIQRKVRKGVRSAPHKRPKADGIE